MVNNKMDLFLLRLRDLIKVYDRLARAVPNVKSAETVVDNALNEVLRLLEDPEMNNLLSGLISGARNRLIESPSDFDHELETRKQELVRAEASVIKKASIRKRDIEYLYIIYREVKQ
jgi:hypothetical protein